MIFLGFLDDLFFLQILMRDFWSAIILSIIQADDNEIKYIKLFFCGAMGHPYMYKYKHLLVRHRMNEQCIFISLFY